MSLLFPVNLRARAALASGIFDHDQEAVDSFGSPDFSCSRHRISTLAMPCVPEALWEEA